MTFSGINFEKLVLTESERKILKSTETNIENKREI